MTFLNKQKYLFALISILLVVSIFFGIHYLTKNQYIIECFQNSTDTTEKTTTVRLPINTRTTCKNMCGSLARCYITGEQCQSDADCYGCKPVFENPDNLIMTKDVGGYDDAGKLGQQALLYSELTSDSVARETYEYKKNQIEPPPQAYFGVNTWKNGFSEGMKYYIKRHGISESEMINMSNYPERYSTTGEFIETGPIAANSFQL